MHAFPATAPRLGLYPVVDSVTWIERLLQVGVRTLQLRIKDDATPAVDSAVREAVALGKQYGARLFINDHWQLALRHHAYGVHLGQEDLNVADLDALREAGLRLGISTHDDAELDRALALRPSYIALGHIFPTQTKAMPSAPQGIVALRRHVARLPGISTVAIGGITAARVPDVLETGVGGIALVSAITQAADWRAVTETLLAQVGSGTPIANNMGQDATR